MTKARNAREDFVSRLRPHEGLGSSVGDLDVAADGRFELPRAAVHAAAQLLLREGGEPSLDQIDPRATGWREMDVKPRMPHQPAMNQWRLVRAGIVDDEMHSEAWRDGRVDRRQEGAELARAMALMELTDDFAALGIECGKQRGGAVPRIVMRPPFGLPGAHRQHRLRAIKGLNLRLLVDAEHEGFVRRVEVEPDD